MRKDGSDQLHAVSTLEAMPYYCDMKFLMIEEAI